jgi:hypothetical protein
VLGENPVGGALNPLGLVTVLAAGVLLIRSWVGALTGRWLTVSVTCSTRGRWIAGIVVVGLMVALEIRQQGRADLLMRGTVTLV